MKKEELRKKLETVIAVRKKAEQKEKELKLKIKEAEEKEKLDLMESMIKTVENILGHKLTSSDLSKFESYITLNKVSIADFMKDSTEL